MMLRFYRLIKNANRSWNLLKSFKGVIFIYIPLIIVYNYLRGYVKGAKELNDNFLYTGEKYNTFFPELMTIVLGITAIAIIIMTYVQYYHSLTKKNIIGFQRYQKDQINWSLKQKLRFLLSLLLFEKEILTASREKIDLDLKILKELNILLGGIEKDNVALIHEFYTQKLEVLSPNKKFMKFTYKETKALSNYYYEIISKSRNLIYNRKSS